MIEVARNKQKSKAWALLVDDRGYPLTGEQEYSGGYDQLRQRLDTHRAGVAAGTIADIVPSRFNKWIGGTYPNYEYEQIGPYLSGLNVLDYIPVMDVKLKFHRLYRGTSDVAIKFIDDREMVHLLRGSSSDEFFELVGQGKIQMVDGYYHFRVTYEKGGDKVYMVLSGYGEE